MKQIICFDIDGVLTKSECFTPEEVRDSMVNEEAVELLERYYREDFIVLYTARRDELIYETLKWLRKNNIRYHAFSNLKIPASVYIDDRAIRYE